MSSSWSKQPWRTTSPKADSDASGLVTGRCCGWSPRATRRPTRARCPSTTESYQYDRFITGVLVLPVMVIVFNFYYYRPVIWLNESTQLDDLRARARSCPPCRLCRAAGRAFTRPARRLRPPRPAPAQLPRLQRRPAPGRLGLRGGRRPASRARWRPAAQPAAHPAVGAAGRGVHTDWRGRPEDVAARLLHGAAAGHRPCSRCQEARWRSHGLARCAVGA